MKKFLFVLCAFLIAASVDAAVERRAAVDVGSGGTKVAVADVDTDTNKIINIIVDASFPVPYQASLDKSADGTLDSETKALGLKTFQQIRDLAHEHKVEKIVAIATSAFRKANNAKEFVAEVEKETNIRVLIIPQREEGEIAFFSAMAAGNFDPQEAVVWDIGTGSLQITTANQQNGLSVYMGENMGSVAFKNYIIDNIQDKDIAQHMSPNPISSVDLKEADSYARAFARKAIALVKQKN